MNNPAFLIAFIVPFLLSFYPQQSDDAKKEPPPSIVIFIADDLSYYDIGYYGNKVVRTPTVDAFAQQSLNFTHLFTPTAMCAPSRSAMFTGMYPHRNGCHMNHGSVKEGTKSIPHYLKPLGYNVALVGKKHIKPESAFPFDYLEENDWEKYLEAHDDKPFCLIYASNEPHGPHQTGAFAASETNVPPNMVETQQMKQLLADYYTDIEIMDKEFKKLLDVLKRNGRDENTIIIFTSDHGYLYNAKWTCYEAGLHVPFMVQWKEKIEPESQTNAMASYVDVLPTLIEIAGGKPSKQFDGKSLVSVLLNKKKEHHALIFGTHTNRGIISGRAYPIRSVRNNRFKYIQNLMPDSTYQNIMTHGRTFSRKDASATWKSWLEKAKKDKHAAEMVDSYQHRPSEELYDLKNDPWEKHNLANEPTYASIKSKLMKNLKEWMQQQGDQGLKSELEVPLHKSD